MDSRYVDCEDGVMSCRVRHKYAEWIGKVLKHDQTEGSVYVLWEKDGLLWKDWHLIEFISFRVPAPSRKIYDPYFSDVFD
jgi:hypothetical protein